MSTYLNGARRAEYVQVYQPETVGQGERVRLVRPVHLRGQVFPKDLAGEVLSTQGQGREHMKVTICADNGDRVHRLPLSAMRLDREPCPEALLTNGKAGAVL